MDYSKARSLMRSGDVLLFEGRAWYSWIIKIRTSSRISHAGFVIRLGGRLCCLEALEGQGVRLYPLTVYLAAGHKIRWHRLNAKRNGIDRRKVVEHALAQWGKRYATPLQFIRSWGYLGRWLGDLFRLPVDVDRDRMFCSELVLDSLQAGGYHPPEGMQPASTSPGDLVFLPCLTGEGILFYDDPGKPTPTAEPISKAEAIETAEESRDG